MATLAASVFFHLGEIRTFIPIRFAVVIVGNGIEARSVRWRFCQQLIGNADNGRGIHPSAELRNDRVLRAQTAPYGMPDSVAETFLVLRIAAEAKRVPRIKFPILLNGDVILPDNRESGWWNRADSFVWRQCGFGKRTDPACGVLFANGGRLVFEH